MRIPGVRFLSPGFTVKRTALFTTWPNAPTSHADTLSRGPYLTFSAPARRARAAITTACTGGHGGAGAARPGVQILYHVRAMARNHTKNTLQAKCPAPGSNCKIPVKLHDTGVRHGIFTLDNPACTFILSVVSTQYLFRVVPALRISMCSKHTCRRDSVCVRVCTHARTHTTLEHARAPCWPPGRTFRSASVQRRTSCLMIAPSPARRSWCGRCACCIRTPTRVPCGPPTVYPTAYTSL